jgi:hypothetical protein
MIHSGHSDEMNQYSPSCSNWFMQYDRYFVYYIYICIYLGKL